MNLNFFNSSNGLPTGIKSMFKLSLFLPLHEVMTYFTWKRKSSKSSHLKGYSGINLIHDLTRCDTE
uniref:Uncharacterized protein n=1 Tax=Sparus aurata TaxID=8175 RepID=A0A671YFV8_SPAAU